MQLPDSLVQAEAAVQALTAALAGADMTALEKCSSNVRDALLSLAVLSQQQSRSGKALDAQLLQRISAVGRQLGPLREQLARSSAMTGRQISALLPAQSAAPTYEALAGGLARSARRYRS